MATIAKTAIGTYRVRYRDPAGRQREKTFPLSRQAHAFANGAETDKNRGTFLDPSAGRITFRSYADRWMAAQPHRPTTADTYNRHLRNHIFPTFGARRVSAITPTEVQGWATRLTTEKNLAPATIHVIHGIFASILRGAVFDGCLAKSPSQRIKLPVIAKTVPSLLEPAQVRALANAMPERYQALVYLGAGCGLRQGEALGVCMSRVRWLERALVVDQQITSVGGKPPSLTPPKTSASNRTIPLPQVVLDALSKHVATYGPDELLFTTTAGNPIRRSWFSGDVWIPAVRAAGLTAGTTFHDLRHTYASLLISHGESVKVVQSRLGHKSAQETLDTYSHLWPDSDDHTRHAVDAAFTNIVETARRAE